MVVIKCFACGENIPVGSQSCPACGEVVPIKHVTSSGETASKPKSSLGGEVVPIKHVTSSGETASKPKSSLGSRVLPILPFIVIFFGGVSMIMGIVGWENTKYIQGYAFQLPAGAGERAGKFIFGLGMTVGGLVWAAKRRSKAWTKLQ